MFRPLVFALSVTAIIYTSLVACGRPTSRS
jgi:NADH:ubiquinone oxidoreductase subunit 4 (subunit M)